MRFFSTLFAVLFFSNIFSQSNYCKPGAFTGDGGACAHSWIQSVSIANLTNLNEVCDKEDPFDPQAADGYSDYSELLVRMEPGGQYTLTVVIDGFIFNAGVAWIDWDNSGDWDDTELIPLVGEGAETNTFTGVVIPPDGAVLDEIIVGGMRVNMDFTFPQDDPCGSNFAGEIEDYSFIVTDKPEPPSEEPNDYCDVQADTPCNFMWITGMTCNNVDYFDGKCDKEDPDPLASPWNGEGYSDYSELTVEFSPGQLTTCTLHVDGNVFDQAAGWIDWDNSGTWDTDELFYFTGETTINEFLVASILVPADAVLGSRIKGGFRVISEFGIAVVDPCAGTEVDGEIEDYSFIVLDPEMLPCPTSFLPADSTQNLCSDVNLQWSTIASAASYQLQVFDGLDTLINLETLDTNYAYINAPRNKELKWLIRPVDSLGRKSYGCDTLSFFTNPEVSPKISLSGLDDSLCIAESQVLNPNVTGTGNMSFQWTGDNTLLDDPSIQSPEFQAKSAGTYKLILTVNDQFGCSDQDSVSKVVLPNPQLTNYQADQLKYCFGEQLSFELESNADSLFFLVSQNAQPLQQISPASQQGNEFTFNSNDTTAFSVEMFLGGCSDTIALDSFIVARELENIQLDFELPVDSLPCQGNEVLLRVVNYSDGLLWQDGTTNDSIYLSESTQISLQYSKENCSVSLDTSFAFEPIPQEVNLSVTGNLAGLCEGDSIKRSHTLNANEFEWFDMDQEAQSRVFYSDASVYVDFVSENGCRKSSDTILISFNTLPDKPIIEACAEGNALCEGQSMMLFIGDTLTKMWNTGSQTDSIEISTAGIYFVKVFKDGCENVSDTFSLDIHPKPEQAEIEIFPNGQADSVWSVAAATNYIWYVDTVLSNLNTRAIPLIEGSNYILEIENEFGCRSEASEVFAFTSIAELQKIDVQLIYNANLKTWEWRSEKAFNIMVWTIDGKLLLNAKDVRESQLKASGVIVVSIDQSGIQQRYKLVK